MPEFLDPAEMRNALRTRTVAALEGFAANPGRLDSQLNNRFGREEPPPYSSSTESYYEEEDDPFYSAQPITDREIDAILEPPLDDNEQEKVGLRVYDEYAPGRRYQDEVHRESKRLDDFIESKHVSYPMMNYLFSTWKRSDQRRAVVIRHNIRKRWEKLGVWNPEWGIPGRVNKMANDRTWDWKWKWQHKSSAPEWYSGGRVGYSPDKNSQHPVTRAIKLRQGLHHGEHAPVLPRSRLPDDASPSQAESFITSRPWFTLSLETAERGVKLDRVPEQRTLGPLKTMEEIWKERGDWKDEWELVTYNHETPVLGWKWRHESPSPEPEDLTPLNNIGITDLNDYSPSEVDALEAIPPPSPRTIYGLRFLTFHPSLGAEYDRLLNAPLGLRVDDPIPPKFFDQADDEPPHQPPAEPESPDASDPSSPPWRSAQSAAVMKSNQSPPPSTTATKRSVPARPPTELETPSKRGRGRPRKSAATTADVLPGKKPTSAISKPKAKKGAVAAAPAAAAAAATSASSKTRGRKATAITAALGQGVAAAAVATKKPNDPPPAPPTLPSAARARPIPAARPPPPTETETPSNKRGKGRPSKQAGKKPTSAISKAKKAHAPAALIQAPAPTRTRGKKAAARIDEEIVAAVAAATKKRGRGRPSKG
ncbi:hypothetical protein B0T17DRAFT_356825 [Bombardia bombarda]|uniref:Uncharacterized protein n=1 Tax=Bombardia bombarda TaxID=252184 RepID=A0AA39WI41_9PEZI|nr:hypothetical protein B0T17DRAFT_356825 [Bombardia bombarda]